MRLAGDKRGLALVFVLIILVALVGVVLSFWYMVDSELKSTGASLANVQAFYIAEAGRAKVRYALTTGGKNVPYSETDISFGNGTYTVTAVYSDPPTNQHVTITSDGYVPNSAKPVAKRRVVEKDIPLGGVNLSLGSTATASATQGNNDPSNAIDGKANTKWVSSAKGTSWLQLDYGSAKTIGRVVVSGSKIDACVIQYSNNGSTWVSVLNPLGSIPGTMTFTPVTARYLGLNISGNKPQVNEFGSYTTSGTGALNKGEFSTSL
jgi:hypothetical protein